MVASERYERDVRRALRGPEQASDDERLLLVGSIFLSSLPDVPEPLREEIRSWYVDLYTSGDPRLPDLEALILRFSAIIDILDDEEWELVQSLVNTHSPEMNLGILQYVMQILMDRGDIG